MGIVKTAVWATLAGIVTLCVLAFFVLAPYPKHQSGETISSSGAQQAGNFIKRVSRQLVNIRKKTVIRGSEDELNNALAIANRTYSGISGYVEFADSHARFFVSLRVRPFGKEFYLNAEADLLNSVNGVLWSNGRIGRLNLSDRQTNFLFRRVFESTVGRRYGRSVLSGIHGLRIKDKELALNFDPPAGFQKGFAKVAQRLSTHSGQALNFETERIQHYLDFLVMMTRELPDEEISLSHYLEAALLEARQQSVSRDSEPAQENTAALFAMAIQMAPGTFRHFITDIRVRRLNATPTPKLVLAGRRDLALHFVYSAALKILSDKGISFSIGETKEIIDANSGGSGFSFADIAADRAGIRFARVAVDNSINARLVQEHCLKGLSETDFFPEHLELPEGLEESEFQQQFESIESTKYQSALAAIDERLADTLILGLTN